MGLIKSRKLVEDSARSYALLGRCDRELGRDKLVTLPSEW